MKDLQTQQAEFIKAYNSLNDPLMQYEFLLQLAGETPLPDQVDKNETFRIHNCQTSSWFIMRAQNHSLSLCIDSDSLLIRGVLGIYVYLLDGRSLSEIVETPLNFMEQTGIREHLSVDRFSVLSGLSETVQGFCREHAG